ncbi:MAG: hypothetical protein MZV63_44255 [Marinilabiliales bacterium]|nr:hypothetical protein [Marinilabiliales bacterium]
MRTLSHVPRVRFTGQASGRVVYASDRYTAAAAGFDDEMIYAELALDNGERSIIMDRGLREGG